jgi:hypothetical protein
MVVGANNILTISYFVVCVAMLKSVSMERSIYTNLAEQPVGT